jgi:hypothetical protein
MLLPIAIALATASSAPHSATRFWQDDYEGARAESKARRVPLFVEVWAPW